VPLPGTGRVAVAVPAPAAGEGNWAGAPSAALDGAGGIVVAYRVRTAEHRGGEVVIACSDDGEAFTPVAVLDKARFGAESLERPAVVRTETGAWRLYVSCATPGSKHWFIVAVDAASPEALAEADARTVFAGDDHTGVKDPVIRRDRDGWHAWLCCHPLDDPGEEDRMTTAYATSTDGLAWEWHGTVLAGRPGHWDARGARLTSFLPDGRATYDGRATKEENFSERTGLAGPASAAPPAAASLGAPLAPIRDRPVSGARYLDVLELRGGGHRLYYEAPLPDGSHELRTELIPPA
jgi:hypothetical protein